MDAGTGTRVRGLRQDVDLVCHRFEAAVGFYRDGLGLPVVTQWAGVVRLDGGRGRWLTLWRADPVADAQHVPAGRHSGASFAVDDLARLYRLLAGAGLRFASAPCRQPWGAVMVNLVDPEGRLVTLVQHRGGLRDWPVAPVAVDTMANMEVTRESRPLSAAR